MSQQLKNVSAEYDAAAQQAQAQLAKAVKSKEWEYAKAAVDAAGIADPTPISDCIGAAMSLAEGDFIGAGLSAVSVVPYFGDAVAKAAKGTRAAKKITALAESIAKISKGLDQLKDKYVRRKEAAKRVREARRQAPSGSVPCSARDKWGVTLPSKEKGRWSGEEGNSAFQPGTWTGEPNKSQFIPDSNKPAISYNEGYPDFSPHVLNVNGKPASVDIDMMGNHSRTGNGDFSQATEAMRTKLNDPTWEPDYSQYTWHHHENGTTMELVPKNINRDYAHTGGASIVNGPTGGTEF